jgi:tetratricopeptide (TPR) repeat protein
MEFLTTGEKIKLIRKQLKMKQSDLQEKNVTRGLISMIEINKRELQYDVALKLIEKFRKKATELGIDLGIDENYLLQSPNEDAQIYCLEKIKNNNINSVIDEVIQIANELNLLEVKAIAYKAMGDECFIKKDYIESFVSYTNSIDIYKDIKQSRDIPYLYWKSALCKANLLQYKEALSYFNLSHHYALTYNDSDIREITLYNIAKCYKKLNKIDLAKIHINNYLTMCNKNKNFNYYVYANILKANCYEIEEKFDSVIDIYNHLIDEISDLKNPLLAIIYNNLGLAYFHKEDFKTSVNYFEMAEKLRNEIDKANLSHTLIEKSSVFLKQKLYDEAIKTLELGLINAENYNDIEYLVKGNYMLADIYNTLKDIENSEKFCLKIVDLLKDTNSADLALIYNKLSIMYLNQNKINKSKRYLMLLQNLINKNEKLLYYVNI